MGWTLSMEFGAKAPLDMELLPSREKFPDCGCIDCLAREIQCAGETECLEKTAGMQ